MEVTQLGVRIRARAMAMVAEETEDNLVAVKRRKLNNENLRSHSSTFVQANTHDCEVPVSSVLEEEPSGSTSLRSSGAQASCSFSTGSMEKLKVSDLKESIETGTAARYDLDGSDINDYLVCSYITPASESKEESVELDSTTAKQSSVMVNSGRTLLQAEKMIPEAELEEFFAAAQEDLNKRFRDKYNFDIVNDIPVKGRFEWIQLNPGK